MSCFFFSGEYLSADMTPLYYLLVATINIYFYQPTNPSYLKEPPSISIARMFLILCPLPHHPYNRVVIALRRYIPLHYHVLPLRLCDFEAEKGGLLKKVETLQVVFLLTPLFFHDTDWDIGVVVLSTVLVLLQLLHVEFVQPVGNDVLGTIKGVKERSIGVTHQVLGARRVAVFKQEGGMGGCLRRGQWLGCSGKGRSLASLGNRARRNVRCQNCLGLKSLECLT